MKAPNGLNINWLLKMAWRDSRRNRSRLFLFVSSIVLGIAALVAIYSLGENMRTEIDNQSASLIGADLELRTNKPVTPSTDALIKSLGDEKSAEQDFASMVLFPKNGGSRLVQVRALEGDFPYYGELETSPVSAGRDFRRKQSALVDQTLMLQFKAQPGDSVKVGNLTFVIAGTLLKAPGQTGLSSSIAPAVYIPMRFMPQTGLSQKGSRINYKYYFQYKKPVNIEALVKKLSPRLEAESIDYNTVQTQKEATGRSFADLTQFLSLVGFIALLLGSIGVASAIHIYIREKVATIAILRCLGVKSSGAFIIYLIQIGGIGFIGSVIGAFLGTFIQQFLPLILKDLLPISISTAVSWKAIGQGILLGIIISILFALLPLVSIRNISPLNTLRISLQAQKGLKDKMKGVVYLLIILFILLFTYVQMHNWTEAFIFTASIIGAFLLLTGMATLLMWLVRRFFPSGWSFLWRQGLANLFRPNNQTVILIISIGLGTAFICTLFFVQSILLQRITFSASGNQPNMVLFDIQPAQKDKVANLTKSLGLPVNGLVPIVNMRLDKVNSITAEKLAQDTTIDLPRNLFNREYRVTFRDTLTASEKITKGKWVGEVKGPTDPVYISFEERYAERNNIHLGDTLTFNVQGAPVITIVNSFREVDWNRIQTNFLVVFPTGVLEEAPQFHVLMTHVPSKEASARFQQLIVTTFPNVSIIDLELVLSILDDILNKIGFVIRFMSAFSILTGLIVLIASVLISKYQRIQESVLLRTLGASRKQIFAITALEYFFLGAFAAGTGIILSLAGSWALAHFSFETPFSPQLLPIVIVFLTICLLTVFIGLINSRGILSKPPLQVLRQEV